MTATTISVSADWTWNLLNDRGTECLEIEDLRVEADITFDGGFITDLSVKRVLGQFPTRVGISWHWLERELPGWLHEQALAAAQFEANTAGTGLADALTEAARDELELAAEGNTEAMED